MADNRSYDPVATGNSVNQQPPRMEEAKIWRQYVIAAVANIAIVSVGYCMGWTSPMGLKFEDMEQSPLPEVVTKDQSSWIGSLLTIGAIFGPFIGGPMASRFGRRWGLISSSIPLLVGWILIAVATNLPLIYAGRIIWGLAVGMIFTISPMYCAEIATDDTRGALGSFLQMFLTVGFFIVYVIGPYISYGAVAYVGIAGVVLFDVLFFFMPETPIYHLTKNDREAATESLMKIRGLPRAYVQEELDKMAASIEEALSKTAKISDIWATKGNIKAMYVSCALVFFQQFCGINAVLFYMTNIFDAANSGLDPSVATIIIGGVQLGASCITPLVVDRLGRKILLLTSACGTTIGLVLLGMFFLMVANENPVAETLSFVPILSLVVFIVTYCFGLGPLPWAVMGELFPIEVKAIAAPIATAFCWILSFLVTKFFFPISEAIGMHYSFWIFGVFCVCAFVFTLFLVPETKGKSFQEIQDLLNGRTPQKEKS